MSVSNHLVAGALGAVTAAAAVWGAPAAINTILSGLAKETTIIVCTNPTMSAGDGGGTATLVLSSCVTDDSRKPIAIIVPELPNIPEELGNME